MKKTVVVSLILAVLCAAAVSAQSADKVTEMIKTDKATWGQACYFSSTYLGLVKDDATPEQSIDALKTAGYIYSTPAASTPIRLDQLALLCAKTWKMRGSLLYTLFPTPRYAFRLLKANGIIATSADPSKTSNGHEALNIFTDCMEKYSTSEETK